MSFSAAEKIKLSYLQRTKAVVSNAYENHRIPSIIRHKGLEKLTLSRMPIARRGCKPAVILKSDLVSTPHCELFYEHGKQWMNDLNSEFGTYLNGTKLYPGLKLEIRPDDIISLGWSPLKVKQAVLRQDLESARLTKNLTGAHRLMYSGKLVSVLPRFYNTKYLVFQLKLGPKKQEWGDSIHCSLDSCASLPNSSMEEIPLLPEDVISEICNYLPVSDVKNCRLVSKLWNSASLPILVKNTKMSLSCYFDSFHKDFVQKNLQFAEEMKNVSHHANVHIRLEFGETKLIRSYNDNLWLFAEYLKFKKLNLSCRLFQKWGFEFLEKMLINSCSTLRELDLKIWKGKNVHEPKVFFHYNDDDDDDEGRPKFQLMKKLTLSLNGSPGSEFLNNVMGAFPILEELVIVNQRLMPELFGLNSSFPRSLTCIEISTFISATSLRHLLAYPHSLTKLEAKVGNLWQTDADLPSTLYDFLKKHQNSLQELKLWVDFDEMQDLNLNFPKLPVLKRLTLLMYSDFGALFEINSGHVGSINHAIHFPSLEHLSIHYDEESFPQFFDFFFPETAQITNVLFSHCKVVEVKFTSFESNFQCLNWLMEGDEPTYRRVSQFFPNLTNAKIETDFLRIV